MPTFSVYIHNGPSLVKSRMSRKEKLWLHREMEFIECTSYNTFYPFQNKHQIHRNLQSIKMLCAFKTFLWVTKWARLTRDHRFLQTMHAPYIPSLCDHNNNLPNRWQYLSDRRGPGAKAVVAHTNENLNREHSALGEVSLSTWSPVFQVYMLLTKEIGVCQSS